MATITWPTSLQVAAFDYSIAFDVQMVTTRNGRISTYGLPGARWQATLTFGDDQEKGMRPALEALLVSLEGGANRLSLGHLGRKIPNGTMRGSPTLNGAHVAGAKQLALSNVTGTLKAGDIIAVPNQLLMAVADAAPTGGLMVVQTRPALFTGYATAAAVAWNNPSTLWVPTTSTAGPFPFKAGRYRPGFAVSFVEAPP